MMTVVTDGTRRGRQLYRNQTTVQVGTTDTILLGSNPKRWAIVVTTPPISGPSGSSTPFTQVNSGASGASAGAILSFTVPAGYNAVLTSASAICTSGSPIPGTCLEINHGGTTVVASPFTGNTTTSQSISLSPGDIATINVITAQPATTVDCQLSGLLYPAFGAIGDIILSFNGPVVANAGIRLHPGTLPFMLLHDHVGQAIREEIHALCSTAPGAITVLDIFEVDCPCQ